MDKKSKAWQIFWVCCLTFALIFVVGLIFGMQKLWTAMEENEAKVQAYAQTRSYLARDAYMEKVSPEYAADRLTELYAQVDGSVQTEAEARKVVLDSLSEKITCAKRVADSTETRLVYTLKCGERSIGRFVLEPRGEAVYGYTPWAVTEEQFNLDGLLTEPFTVIAPQDYSVYVGGKLLDESHITERGIPYPEFAEFQDTYPVPTKVCYTVGPLLGEAQVTILTPDGQTVAEGVDADWSAYLDNCTGEQEAQVKDFTAEFLRRYVRFTTTSQNLNANYRDILEYIVPGTTLAKRMKQALDGLGWVHGAPDTLVSHRVNTIVRLSDGRYFCDVSYEMDVKRPGGTERIENHMRLILQPTDAGLKAEAMTQY